MHESIYIAASAGLKQARKMEMIAQNLANVNNTGYKKDGLVFKEMMPPFPPDLENEAAKNILLTPEKSNKNVSYVGITDSYTDFSTGAMKNTGGALDLAIDGEGFFKVQRGWLGLRWKELRNFSIITPKFDTSKYFLLIGSLGVLVFFGLVVKNYDFSVSCELFFVVV